MKKFNISIVTILFKKIGFISLCLILLATSPSSFAQTEGLPVIDNQSSVSPDNSTGPDGTRTVTTTKIGIKGGDRYTIKYVVIRDAKKKIHDSTRTVTTDRSDKFIDEFHYTYSKANNGTETITKTNVKRDDAGYEDRTTEKFTKKAD